MGLLYRNLSLPSIAPQLSRTMREHSSLWLMGVVSPPFRALMSSSIAKLPRSVARKSTVVSGGSRYCVKKRLSQPVRAMFRTIFFFPYVASMVAICVCWNFMLMKDGPVNQMIMALGINFNKSWTADSTMAMWAIILVSVWRSMGYYMVICLAALQGVPRELYEAATVDGANKWQQFRNVTLPQIKPTTFFCTIMLVIGSFKIYDTVAIMTNGGPGRATKMLVTYIYDVAFNNIKYGQASAIAMVLLVIVLIVTIIQFANEKKFAND